MSNLNQLETEKNILLHNLKVKRISWKMQFIKNELAYKRYEDYMNSFFPRSIIFRFLIKYPAIPVLALSFLTVKKSRHLFFNIIKKIF